MTSQTTQETPACPDGHGLMVPMDYEFAFAPRDGLMTVLVEWQDPEDKIVPWGYAASEQARAELPSGDHMGDQIAALQADSKLVSVYDVMNAEPGYFRIDDNREGHNWGYLVWLGSEQQDGVSFIPRTVYHWFDHRVEEHQFPALTNFDQVVALMDEPNRLLITDVGDLARKDMDDPEVKARWSFDDRVVVQDWSAILLNGRRRRQEQASTT
jgi:hypothetical protein